MIYKELDAAISRILYTYLQNDWVLAFTNNSVFVSSLESIGKHTNKFNMKICYSSW